MAVDYKTAFDRIEQMLEFPANFPIKIMGARVDEFAQTIAAVITEHVPEFDPAALDIKVSSKGTYLSLTADLQVKSRVQLETLYRALGEHPLVKVVL
jgi:uncharacterized protein